MGNDLVITQSSLIRTLTVGTGITPVQKNRVQVPIFLPLAAQWAIRCANSLVGFTTGMEFHQSPKIMIISKKRQVIHLSLFMWDYR